MLLRHLECWGRHLQGACEAGNLIETISWLPLVSVVPECQGVFRYLRIYACQHMVEWM